MRNVAQGRDFLFCSFVVILTKNYHYKQRSSFVRSFVINQYLYIQLFIYRSGGNSFARVYDACSRYEPLSLHLFHLLCLPLKDCSKQKKWRKKSTRRRERDDDFLCVLFLSFLFVCPPLVNTSQDKDISLFQ